VVSRPLRVEELAEFLAFDFEAGQIPKFREDWLLEDPVEVVLFTCSTFLSLANVEDSQVIQISYFSVKEYLMSTRFAEKSDTISRRYHVSMPPAWLRKHAWVFYCTWMKMSPTIAWRNLLSLNTLRGTGLCMPVLRVCQKTQTKAWNGCLTRRNHILRFGSRYLTQQCLPGGEANQLEGRCYPVEPPLHYAAFCGLHEVVRVLAIEHSEDVNSRSFNNKSTPLHLASQEGHVEVAQSLVEHGADAAAQSEDGRTPLHFASEWGHLDVARFLVEHGMNAAAQTEDGRTPLHRASSNSHLDAARFLVEHGADAATQSEDGLTPPLHLASKRGYLDLAGFDF